MKSQSVNKPCTGAATFQLTPSRLLSKASLSGVSVAGGRGGSCISQCPSLPSWGHGGNSVAWLRAPWEGACPSPLASAPGRRSQAGDPTGKPARPGAPRLGRKCPASARPGVWVLRRLPLEGRGATHLGSLPTAASPAVTGVGLYSSAASAPHSWLACNGSWGPGPGLCGPQDLGGHTAQMQTTGSGHTCPARPASDVLRHSRLQWG